MAEPLTDVERLALEWLRDGKQDRFRSADASVRDALVARGLVLRAGRRPAERYTITNRGLEALDAAQG